MKKLIISLCVVLFLSASSVQAADPWSKGDVFREVAFQALNAIDFIGTDRMLQDHRGQVIELNPFLGAAPSRDTLLYTGIGIGLSHAIVTHLIPAKYRPYWQYSFIIIKAGAVANNYGVDVGFQF